MCGADGTCTNPDSDTLFCDGYLKQSGVGVITCFVDADCTALDGICPGGDCGTCSISTPRPCFPDPTVNDDGHPGQSSAVLTAQFCTAPTGSGVDGAAGAPGLTDLSLDFAFTGLCADGATEFELGGNNCPAP